MASGYIVSHRPGALYLRFINQARSILGFCKQISALFQQGVSLRSVNSIRNTLDNVGWSREEKTKILHHSVEVSHAFYFENK